MNKNEDVPAFSDACWGGGWEGETERAGGKRRRQQGEGGRGTEEERKTEAGKGQQYTKVTRRNEGIIGTMGRKGVI